jgi:CDP-diacylglycerol--glycerol-3-phosphate 3-phosphatidyltransferase
MSASYWGLYALCGISDILDGIIARKISAVSALGSALDSIADVVLFACILWTLLPTLSITLWMMCWIISIATIRVTSLITHFLRLGKAAFLHTYSNKITGVAIFLFPFLYAAFGLNPAMIMVCAIATISAIEELVIAITSKKLQRDIKGIFIR